MRFVIKYQEWGEFVWKVAGTTSNKRDAYLISDLLRCSTTITTVECEVLQ